MNRKKTAWTLILAGCTFTGGYVAGQVAQGDADAIKSRFKNASAVGGDENDAIVQDVLRRAASDPAALRAVTETFTEWDGLAKKTDSSYKVVTMLQNQRIIELLEKIEKQGGVKPEAK